MQQESLGFVTIIHDYEFCKLKNRLKSVLFSQLIDIFTNNKTAQIQKKNIYKMPLE